MRENTEILPHVVEKCSLLLVDTRYRDLHRFQFWMGEGAGTTRTEIVRQGVSKTKFWLLSGGDRNGLREKRVYEESLY